MLDGTPSGLRGAALPYRQVIIIAATGSVVSLVTATLWPEIQQRQDLTFIGTAAGIALVVWSILGRVQVIEELVKHMEKRNKANELEARRRAAEGQIERDT